MRQVMIHTIAHLRDPALLTTRSPRTHYFGLVKKRSLKKREEEMEKLIPRYVMFFVHFVTKQPTSIRNGNPPKRRERHEKERAKGKGRKQQK